MHKNSLTAYSQERRTFNRRENEIMGFLTRHGPATDRKIKDCLGYKDMNNVRPRISDLIRDRFLHETGTEIDSETGKRVRIVGVSGIHAQLSLGI